MPAGLGSKLLRVLAEKEFKRRVPTNCSDIRLSSPLPSIPQQLAMRELTVSGPHYRLNVRADREIPLRQRLTDFGCFPCESIPTALIAVFHELGGDALALLASGAPATSASPSRTRTSLLADHRKLLDAARRLNLATVVEAARRWTTGRTGFNRSAKPERDLIGRVLAQSVLAWWRFWRNAWAWASLDSCTRRSWVCP